MKYTAEQLGVLPNAVINGTLRRLIYGDDKDIIRLKLDFCNDASTVMPHAFDRIALMVKTLDGTWRVESTTNDCYCWAANDVKLLRAVAIVLILVLQERNV